MESWIESAKASLRVANGLFVQIAIVLATLSLVGKWWVMGAYPGSDFAIVLGGIPHSFYFGMFLVFYYSVFKLGHKFFYGSKAKGKLRDLVEFGSNLEINDDKKKKLLRIVGSLIAAKYWDEFSDEDEEAARKNLEASVSFMVLENNAIADHFRLKILDTMSDERFTQRILQIIKTSGEELRLDKDEVRVSQNETLDEFVIRKIKHFGKANLQNLLSSEQFLEILLEQVRTNEEFRKEFVAELTLDHSTQDIVVDSSDGIKEDDSEQEDEG